MFKFVALLLALAAAFGAGYYVGQSRTLSLERTLSDLRHEMGTKTQVLQQEVAAARVRMNLLEARERLIQAQKHLVEKNFGQAEKEISGAEEQLSKATALAKDAGRQPLVQRLQPISSSLKETQTAVRRLSPEAKGKLAGLERELDRVID
jgi:uncharacterized protein HemX